MANRLFILAKGIECDAPFGVRSVASQCDLAETTPGVDLAAGESKAVLRWKLWNDASMDLELRQEPDAEQRELRWVGCFGGSLPALRPAPHEKC